MKKIIFLFLFLCSIACHEAFAQPTFSFTPGQVVVDEGEEVCFSLRVADFTDILSASFTIAFDPGVIQYTGVQNFHPSVTGLGAASFDASLVGDGFLQFNWTNGQPCNAATDRETLNDGQVLFEVCFVATGIYANHTPIELTDAPMDMEVRRYNANCIDIGEFVDNSFLSIGVQPLTLNLSSGDGFEGDIVCIDLKVEDFDNIVAFQFGLYWDVDVMIFEDVLPSNLPGFTSSNFGLDQAGDGQIIVSWYDPSLNGIDLADGTEIVQLCFKLTGGCGQNSTVYIEDYVTGNGVEPIEVYNNISSQGDGTVMGLITTDGEVAVNCFNPNGITLNIEDKDVCPGETFTVDVEVADFQDITKLMFNLKWNPNVIQLNNSNGITYPFGTPCFLFGSTGTVTSLPSQGKIEVDWSQNFPGCDLSNGHVLMRLHFTAVGASGTNSTIAVVNPIFVDQFGGQVENIGINNNNGLVSICELDNPTLISSSQDANPGEIVCFEFTTLDFEDITRTQYTISWEPNVLSYQGYQNLNLTNLSGFNFLADQAGTLGVLGVEWENGMPVTVPDGTAIFELCFEVVGDPGDCSAISFTDNPWPVDVETSSSNGTNVGLNGQEGSFCTLNPLSFETALNTIYGSPNASVCLDVTVENFVQLTNMEYSFNWNTSKLQYNGIQLTGNLPNFNAGSYDDSPALTDNGQLVINWSSGNTLQGTTVPDGTVIFQLCFTILGNQGDCSGVTFSEFPMPYQITTAPTGNANLGLTADNGSVCVSAFLNLDNAVITDVDCASNPTGAIDLTIVGGSGDYNYEWSGAGVNPTSEDQNSLSPGKYYVTVTDVDNPALSLQLDFDVELSPDAPIANAGVDTAFTCDNGFFLILNGGGSSMGPGFSYSWANQPGGLSGIITNGQNTLYPEVLGGDCYILTVSDNNSSCVDRDTVCISSQVMPSVDIQESDTLTCLVDTVILNGGQNPFLFEIEWTAGPGGNIVPGTENSTLPKVTASAWYYLRMSHTATGCEATDSVFVVENRLEPDISAGADKTLGCGDNQVSLDGTNASTGDFNISWSPVGPGELCGPSNALQTNVCSPGIYELIVTNTASGCSSIDIVEVEGDTLKPVANTGPDAELTCLVNQVVLDGSASSQGAAYVYTWKDENGVAVGNELTLTVDQPGMYTLEVMDTDNGCNAISEVMVSENKEYPTVMATVNHAITCDVTSATLDATGSSEGVDFTYRWVDPTGTDAGSELTLDVDTPGQYVFHVTNTMTGCIDSVEIEVVGNNQIPVVEAGEDTFIGCQNSIVLNGTSDMTGPEIQIQWVGPVGNCLTNSTSLQANAACDGDYILIVQDTATGCVGMDTISVIPNDTPPVVDAGDNSPFPCSLDELALEGTTDQNDFTALWTSPAGNPITDPTSLTPSVTLPGTYNLTVTSNLNGCTAVDFVVISQPTLPTADAGDDQFVDCLNTTQTISAAGSTTTGTTITWEALQGSIDVSQVNEVDAEVGAGVYLLTVIDDNSCIATDTVEVINNGQLPLADAGNDIEIGCDDTVITLDGSASDPGLTYVWTNEDGGIVGNGLTADVNATGTYILTVYNSANNCESSDVVVVSQASTGAPAEAAFDHDPCSIEAVLLGNLPVGATGVWTTSGSAVIEDPTAETAIVTGLQEGENTFTWTLTLGNCISYSSASVIITVNQSVPVANDDQAVLVAGMGGSISVPILDNDIFDPTVSSISLVNNGGVFGAVDLSDDGILTYVKEKCVVGTVEITYQICNIDCPEICSEATVRISVEADDADGCDEVPNGITPNGDGINDALVFDILLNNTNEYPNNEMIVFNRWGDIVYQARPYLNDWQGTNEAGDDLPHGTYYYILRLNIGDGEIIRGDVTILK